MQAEKVNDEKCYSVSAKMVTYRSWNDHDNFGGFIVGNRIAVLISNDVFYFACVLFRQFKHRVTSSLKM